VSKKRLGTTDINNKSVRYLIVFYVMYLGLDKDREMANTGIENRERERERERKCNFRLKILKEKI